MAGGLRELTEELREKGEGRERKRKAQSTTGNRAI